MICSYMVTLCSTGNVLCNPENPVRVSTSLEARVIVFDVEIPITMGFPVRTLIIIAMYGDGILVKKQRVKWLYWLTAC